MVYSTVNSSTVESVLIPEPHFTFPALPVAESDLVVIGTVGAGQAHLSENKKNVFSEFTLVVGNRSLTLLSWSGCFWRAIAAVARFG